MDRHLNAMALAYHRTPVTGKLAIRPTKPMNTHQDLALAYSPGVAAACQAIADNPLAAADLTARSHLVAVISNGTAVLGMGNLGPLASKPVMEGKAVLFKKFADLDAFDIEVDEYNLDALVETIARLEPTFGGINLEDFRAPECFELERRLQKIMKIPVFHDDQHGTAIVVAAALCNALKLTHKPIANIRLVTSGAGAAAIACLDLLVTLGMRRENVIITDLEGVVYHGRPGLVDVEKLRYAAHTPHRKLADAMVGCDVFLGLSVGNVVSREMVATMAPHPLVFALANPTPEISPMDVQKVRPDAIYATGRSDYKNQINNLLCFPFIFRGALDVGATVINTEMKLACVQALADLAHKGGVDVLYQAYPGESFAFGSEYIIPKPFDPRLLTTLAPAVAQAAIASGVATRPDFDIAAYRRRLRTLCKDTAGLFRVLPTANPAAKPSVLFVQGESDPVLQAVGDICQDQSIEPVLFGDRDTITQGLHAHDVDAHQVGIKINPTEALEHFVAPGSSESFIIATATESCQTAAAWGRALWGVPDKSDEDSAVEEGFFDLYVVGEQAFALCASESAQTLTERDLTQLGARAAQQLRRLNLRPQLPAHLSAGQDRGGIFKAHQNLMSEWPTLIETSQPQLPDVSIILAPSAAHLECYVPLMHTLSSAKKIGSFGLSSKRFLIVCPPYFGDIVDVATLLGLSTVANTGDRLKT